MDHLAALERADRVREPPDSASHSFTKNSWGYVLFFFLGHMFVDFTDKHDWTYLNLNMSFLGVYPGNMASF